MAQIVFSGGHTLSLPGTQEEIEDVLTENGEIKTGWSPIRVGDKTVTINPSQIAYIADDEGRELIYRSTSAGAGVL
jgi:L-lysine 2,3-aminomutase